MQRTIEKLPQNKIDGLNLIEDIKLDLIELFSPVMQKLKLKVDGSLDKKSTALVSPIYAQLRAKYGNNLRVYLDTKNGSSNYFCFNCDLWVVTKITSYDNPNITPDHSGEYLKFYINYVVDQNIFSDYDKREKITLEGLQSAQLRHKKYKEQLEEIQTLINMVERDYKLDKYGSFI